MDFQNILQLKMKNLIVNDCMRMAILWILHQNLELSTYFHTGRHRHYNFTMVGINFQMRIRCFTFQQISNIYFLQGRLEKGELKNSHSKIRRRYQNLQSWIYAFIHNCFLHGSWSLQGFLHLLRWAQ